MSEELPALRRELPPKLESRDRNSRPAAAVAALAPFIALAIIPKDHSPVFLIADSESGNDTRRDGP